MHLEACCALPQVAGSGGSMWGHCDGGAGGRKTRPGPSPGSTAEEGGPGGRRKDFEEGSEEGENGDDNSPPNNGRDPPEEGVKGERKGGSDIKMEGGGYYPSVHPGNHHGGGVHQPLVRGGGGYPGGPRDPGGALEEGEVRRSRGPSATRDGVVIIERRPSQEGIQPAEMQVLIITSSRSISLTMDTPPPLPLARNSKRMDFAIWIFSPNCVTATVPAGHVDPGPVTITIIIVTITINTFTIVTIIITFILVIIYIVLVGFISSSLSHHIAHI